MISRADCAQSAETDSAMVILVPRLGARLSFERSTARFWKERLMRFGALLMLVLAAVLLVSGSTGCGRNDNNHDMGGMNHKQ